MDCWSKIQGRLVDLILWCWWLLVCKSSFKTEGGSDGAGSSRAILVVWSLELTGGIMVLTVPVALRARALGGGCWLGFLLPVTLGPGGWWGVLWPCWADCSQQGHCLWRRHLAQGTHGSFSPSRPALAERKGGGSVSFLLRPWGGFLGGRIWAVLGTWTCF